MPQGKKYFPFQSPFDTGNIISEGARLLLCSEASPLAQEWKGIHYGFIQRNLSSPQYFLLLCFKCSSEGIFTFSRLRKWLCYHSSGLHKARAKQRKFTGCNLGSWEKWELFSGFPFSALYSSGPALMLSTGAWTRSLIFKAWLFSLHFFLSFLWLALPALCM